MLTCSSGRWDRSVTCDPVDCGVPDQSHVYYAEFSCPKGTTYLKRCSFSCIHPAKLRGTVWRAEGFKTPFLVPVQGCSRLSSDILNFPVCFCQPGGPLRLLLKWWAHIPFEQGHHGMGILSVIPIPGLQPTSSGMSSANW